MVVGAEGAAIAAAIANAVKASGAIVQVRPEAFSTIASKGNNPLIVVSESSFLGRKSYQYLTSYKGLIFYTKSSQPVSLTGSAEIVSAGKIWVPG
jgi:hypothetical protein